MRAGLRKRPFDLPHSLRYRNTCIVAFCAHANRSIGRGTPTGLGLGHPTMCKQCGATLGHDFRLTQRRGGHHGRAYTFIDLYFPIEKNAEMRETADSWIMVG